MKGMLIAAKVMALTGAQLFKDPEMLKQVRKEFLEKREKQNYSPLKARSVTERAEEIESRCK